MNLTISAPPYLTGDGATDAAKLNDWCRSLYLQLKRILYSIGDENIISISPEKIESGCTLMSADSFVLSTPDGTQFIKCIDGNIEINAASITCDELIAPKTGE